MQVNLHDFQSDHSLTVMVNGRERQLPERALAEGISIRAWDFLFYALFGFVVTSFVRIGGVLMIFSYLIVPAICANFLAVSLRARMALPPWVALLLRVEEPRVRPAQPRRGRARTMRPRYSVVRRSQPALATIGLAFRRATTASSSSGSAAVPSKVATSSTSSSFSLSSSMSFTG